MQSNKTKIRIKIRKRMILSPILSRQNQNGYILFDIIIQYRARETYKTNILKYIIMNSKIKTKIYQLNFLHENQLLYSATFECSGLIALKAFISETLSIKDSYPSCFADAIEYTEIE